MSYLTVQQLERISPVGVPHIMGAIASHADFVFPKYGLTKILRVQHFLAQIAEETSGFRLLFENLDYSAERLRQVWPNRFTAPLAEACAHKPREIADIVYQGRMGNTLAGDGWTYRGLGLLDMTGRSMFQRIEGVTGIPLVLHPEYAASDEYMLEAAVASFVSLSGILELCDADDIVGVTRRVNGGLNGLATRELYLRHAKVTVPTLGGPGDGSQPRPMPSTSSTHVVAGFDLTTISGLQSALNRLLPDKIDVDGIMGEETREEIEAFQEKVGLSQDGVAGPLTIGAIESALRASP